MVAHKPHRIDGLQGGTGRYQHVSAGKILWGQHLFDAVGNEPGIGQTAGACGFTGQSPGVRIQNMNPVFFQQIQVPLHPDIFIHMGVHGRTDQNRGGHRQKRGGQGIIGQGMGQFGNTVGRGRGDHCGITPGGRIDVGHRSVGVLPQVRDHGIFRQHFKGGFSHKPQGRRRHGHIHAGAGLFQQPHQLHGLVSGNPAGHPQQNLFSSQDRHWVRSD